MTIATSTSLSFWFLALVNAPWRIQRSLVILIMGIGLVIGSRLAPLEIVAVPMLIFYFWQIYNTFRLCGKRYPHGIDSLSDNMTG
jgi:hypothetical protein